MTLTGRQLQQNRVLLEHKLVTDLPLVMADRVQLQQVLLNLVINGIEAMTGAEHNQRLPQGVNESLIYALLSITITPPRANRFLLHQVIH